MKKSLFLLLAVFCAIALAACGNDTEREFGQPDANRTTTGDNTVETPSVTPGETLDGATTPQQDDDMPLISSFNYELIVGDIVFSPVVYNFYFNELKFLSYEMYFTRDGEEPFDLFIPLDEQQYWSGGITWADYMHNRVAEAAMQFAAAHQAGYTLTEEQVEFITDMREWMFSMAMEEGMSVDQMVGEVFDGLTGDEYVATIENDILTHNWRNSLFESFSFTVDEMRAFYELNWQEIDPWNEGVPLTSAANVDVRHILIAFPQDATAEEEAAAVATAQEIYAYWRAGPATEASFAQLAMERTEDFASAEDGGLYSEVWPGMTVPEFNDWIFDESRQHGDTDIVISQFGPHIMFFVQANGIDWELRTDFAMREYALDARIQELMNEFEIIRREV